MGVSTMHWPWGAGMFATSLGPKDACFVLGANWEKGSGYTVVWGRLCAWQKWIIEWSKVDECLRHHWPADSAFRASHTSPPLGRWPSLGILNAVITAVTAERLPDVQKRMT